MKIILTVHLLFFLIFFAPCQENHIIIGSGGGFTGEIIQYKILPDGKVYKGSGFTEADYTGYCKQKRSHAKAFVQQGKSIHATPMNKPGNMYYFIYISNDTGIKKYVWGETGYTPPSEITAFYRETLAQVAKLKFKTIEKK